MAGFLPTPPPSANTVGDLYADVHLRLPGPTSYCPGRAAESLVQGVKPLARGAASSVLMFWPTPDADDLTEYYQTMYPEFGEILVHL